MATLVTFHAHPDDEAIATGGTMVKAAAAGHRVVLVVATRGEQGEPLPGVLNDGEQLGDRRELEAREAGRVLGADRVEFLGYRDSGMMGEPTNDEPDAFWQADVDEAAARLAAILRDVDADVLTVYDSHGGYGHPDHIQVHRVGMRAADMAGVEHVYQATMNRDRIRKQMEDNPELAERIDEERRDRAEEPQFGVPEAEITHAIDVTEHLDAKRKALEIHASQISEEMFFLSLDDEQFAEAFGTEWYVARSGERDGGFVTDLFDR